MALHYKTPVVLVARQFFPMTSRTMFDRRHDQAVVRPENRHPIMITLSHQTSSCRNGRGRSFCNRNVSSTRWSMKSSTVLEERNVRAATTSTLKESKFHEVIHKRRCRQHPQLLGVLELMKTDLHLIYQTAVQWHLTNVHHKVPTRDHRACRGDLQGR